MRYRVIFMAVLVAAGLAAAVGVFAGDEGTQQGTDVEILRAQGPSGLRGILAEYDALRAGKSADPQELKRLRCTIDAVAAQRDAHVSRLYWYTDLEQAKAQAAGQDKPILSLRLLGTLDTELSCANSRFFRTVLYANAEISGYLREHYILHWQSVRPVPKITIDFGDGRKIERTITGNSIHYILTPDGHVVDALPGLYAPATFLGILQEARPIAGQDGSSRAALREYQAGQLSTLRATWQNDLALVAGAVDLTAGNAIGPRPAAPTARQANARSVSKRALETPSVQAVAAPVPPGPAAIDDQTWRRIAALHAADAKLDRASVELIRAKQPAPDAQQAARRAIAKSFAEDPLLRIVRNFEGSIAEDTVRNQHLFRTQILAWLIDGDMTELNALNERVYAELFLTPSSDPWLGLLPQDTYAGIEDGGIIVEPISLRETPGSP